MKKPTESLVQDQTFTYTNLLFEFENTSNSVLPNVNGKFWSKKVMFGW